MGPVLQLLAPVPVGAAAVTVTVVVVVAVVVSEVVIVVWNVKSVVQRVRYVLSGALRASTPLRYTPSPSMTSLTTTLHIT